MTYVALEGGGEVISSTLGGHVTVASGNLAEVVPHVDAGKLRVLAVFAAERLPGKFSTLPTAREQGIDVVWPVVRGFYMGPKVSDEAFGWWQRSFDTLLASEAYPAIRERFELFPFVLTGPQLTAYVEKQVAEMRTLSKEFELLQ